MPSLPHRRRVSFVYAEEYRGAGTTVMRGEQLAAIARQSVPHSTIDFAPLSRSFRGRHLFLTKGVLKTATAEDFTQWRARGNRILIDPVDEDIPEVALHFADVIVAASRSAAADYRDRFPGTQVAVLDHHVDPRVAPIVSGAARPSLGRVGYFGEPENAFRSGRIDRRVEFIPVDTSRQSPEWLERLPHYSAHYAVRQSRDLDDHKPFLKGFTAAACEAVIIVDRAQQEPHHWLPADYPYWVDSSVDDGSVTETLDRVRRDFGSRTWKRAAESMRLMASQTSRQQIGNQLRALFS
ncbi:hypothetical protein GCM10009808_02620 [Microbacterium sediminicola]|uniref:Glycosyltransferase family 1 protein n=1 Tax=Microbacterium sediminicola TaxID=415210 RepID=A0ABN2HLL5_9MICO